ncbi:hypothetical protein [Humibacillus xanthopallidus]|uniref:MinD-like ATPase involved in chromosome partitioning or flagellar assembly n=1 Tax=Humibacillus xanthopallidus TaxID=412689 RepID=A0A543HZV4_9MICO|nr:hypothetical protein [Humibacillus xanthopallidus]TQM63810.1 hypothetical protein FBY41_0163 [Humibacillus xanthopallidus]
MTTTAGPRRAVSTDELKRAWLAVQAGQFRSGGHLRRATSPTPGTSTSDVVWEPSEPVLTVIGCHGCAGATTLAVAIATASGAARVIECATATASGLAAAATAELGHTGNSWSQGRRDRVLLERITADVTGSVDVPLPAAPTQPVGLSVLDVSCELGQLLAGSSWLAEQVRRAPTVIAVTSATVPGLRRLEGALALLDDHDLADVADVVAGVVGPRRARWPRGIAASEGPRTRELERCGRLVEIPTDTGLAARGLDSQPLPPALLRAAATLLRLARPDIHEKDLPS